MRTELAVHVEAGRLPRITACGGLAARLTAPDTVHLVSTAMTPLGGDEVTVRVTVGQGARLTVRSVAATVALPGRATRASTSRWLVEVAAGGVLEVDCEPLIVAADADHTTTTEVTLEEGAALRLRERVQLGRAGEGGAARWSGVLRADLAGTPLLRHRLALGGAADDALTAWRATEGELTYPAAGAAPAAGLDTGTGHVVMALAGGGTLRTWVGRRLTSGSRRL